MRERDASKIHVQLCLALLLMAVIYIVGIERTENEVVCTIMSTLFHYLALAAVFWMGAEAILMFKKLVIVFGSITKTFHIVLSLICWGMLSSW